MTHESENRGDLPYDYEDFGLDEQELIAKYADTGVHPEHGLEAYRQLTEEEQHAHNGYWGWVSAQISEDDKTY